jgi:hypothetical protein
MAGFAGSSSISACRRQFSIGFSMPLVDRVFTVPAQRDPLDVQRMGNAMSSSNGADLGQVMAFVGDVLAGQTQMLDRMDRLELRVREIECQVKELSSQVTAYHGSVVGHGVLISELETRVQKIEERLEPLPTA